MKNVILCAAMVMAVSLVSSAFGNGPERGDRIVGCRSRTFAGQSDFKRSISANGISSSEFGMRIVACGASPVKSHIMIDRDDHPGSPLFVSSDDDLAGSQGRNREHNHIDPKSLAAALSAFSVARSEASSGDDPLSF